MMHPALQFAIVFDGMVIVPFALPWIADRYCDSVLWLIRRFKVRRDD